MERVIKIEPGRSIQTCETSPIRNCRLRDGVELAESGAEEPIPHKFVRRIDPRSTSSSVAAF